MPDTIEDKPQRLYFDSYIQVIHNSVGANTWRNFYIKNSQAKVDVLEDGDKSCAFFVSSILLIFKKLEAIHATVKSTVDDMKRSGWQEVKEPKIGDVLVWEPTEASQPTDHIGFYIGNSRAISNSSSKRTPTEHDMHYDEKNRRIVQILRVEHWDEA